MKPYKFILIALFLTTIISLHSVNNFLDSPLLIPSDGIFFVIKKGEPFSSVASRLKEENIVSHELILRIYSRLKNLDSSIQQGEYHLRQGLSVRSLISRFTRGDVIRHKITFPEGITLRSALEMLKARKNIKSTLLGTKDEKLLDLTGRKNPEGLFLADTYSYYRGDSDLEILVRANTVLLEFLTGLWQGRIAGLPYKTSYEALILASIIEKETALAIERPLIAGVFVRRLNLGMRLQADPTVIYGLNNGFDGNLRRIHLNDRDNPYNTYKNDGLPPTPIALSGRDSLAAAFNPDSGSAIYFVADGGGGHVFNASLKEHNAAVRRFQARRTALD